MWIVGYKATQLGGIWSEGIWSCLCRSWSIKSKWRNRHRKVWSLVDNAWQTDFGEEEVWERRSCSPGWGGWEIPGLVFVHPWVSGTMCTHSQTSVSRVWGLSSGRNIPFLFVSHYLGLSTWCMCLWMCRLQSVNPVIFSLASTLVIP